MSDPAPSETALSETALSETAPADGIADSSGSSGSSGGETPPPRNAAPRPPDPRGRPRVVRSLVIGSVIAIVLAVLLFVGLGTKSGTGTGSSSGPVVPIGGPAPTFSLPSLTGGTQVDLDALGKHAHRPVVLNFFASWCTPCQKETPLLARMATAEQAKGGRVQFIGVDVNDPTANALSFVRKTEITYPVAVDRTFQVTSNLYGLYGLPQTFFIGSDGRVLGHTVGAVHAADLESWMKKLGGVGK